MRSSICMALTHVTHRILLPCASICVVLLLPPLRLIRRMCRSARPIGSPSALRQNGRESPAKNATARSGRGRQCQRRGP